MRWPFCHYPVECCWLNGASFSQFERLNSITPHEIRLWSQADNIHSSSSSSEGSAHCLDVNVKEHLLFVENDPQVNGDMISFVFVVLILQFNGESADNHFGNIFCSEHTKVKDADDVSHFYV